MTRKTLLASFDPVLRVMSSDSTETWPKARRLCIMSLLLSVLLLSACPYASAQELLWDFATPQAVLSSPVVSSEGTVYFGSYDRNLYAVTSAGSQSWTLALPSPVYIYFGTYTAVYGTPSLAANGVLYVPCENGNLLAVDSHSGSNYWTHSTPTAEGVYASTALASDGTIYFGSYDKHLYAITPAGTRKWASLLGATIFASPAVGSDGTIYCGADDGVVYALHPANGTKSWIFTTGTNAIVASPAISSNGDLYLGVGSYKNPSFYSISPAGATNWIFHTGAAIRSSAALDRSGNVYFGCDDGFLYCLRSDGSLNWSFNAGSPIGSSPALADDGVIYFGADDGNFYALGPGGNLLWNWHAPGKVFASPAIGLDGSVYFASDDGSLHVLRGRRPPMNSDWPMFRHDAWRSGRAPGAVTNSPPVLASIPDYTVAPGSTLTITNSALDSDVGQQITYHLAIGAPAGAAIDPGTGLFTWTPASSEASTTNLVGIVAVDSASPPLSDVKWFSIVVTAGGASAPSLKASFDTSTLTLSWNAIPGTTYRLQYKSDLSVTNWTDLAGDVTATSTTATKSDPATGTQRFYRLEVLP